MRFREIERSEREAAIPCEERKWWRRGKIFALELELELEDRESGVEEGKMRRSTRRSSEIKEESKAANFRDSICVSFCFPFVGNRRIGVGFDFLGNRGAS